MAGLKGKGGLLGSLRAKLRDADIRRQIVRYLISGVLSFSVEYLILYGLTDFSGVWYISSNTLALTAGFWISFLMNRYWSFGSKTGLIRQIILYGTLFAFNLGASNTIIYLLTEKAGLYYIFSKLAATAVIVMWNFILYRMFIFKEIVKVTGQNGQKYKTGH